ncbi:MAG: GIY-YIG nuclease family protein [bacterium]
MSLRTLQGRVKQSQGETKMLERKGYIYLMTNKRNTVIYTGVTSDLKKRVYEHKEKLADGFTKKYNVNKLVYYEIFSDIRGAILREKQIKAGSRKKKIDLIKSINPEFRDMYSDI